MSMLLAVVSGLVETVRESLPTDERDLGPFVAGLAWACVMNWLLLIVVSWAAITAAGGRP